MQVRCSQASAKSTRTSANTLGKGNGSSAQPVTGGVGWGLECLTHLAGIRTDFREEVVPELSHEKGRSGGRGLLGRGVCGRKLERKNEHSIWGAVSRLMLLVDEIQGKGVLNVEVGTTVSSRLRAIFVGERIC